MDQTIQVIGLCRFSFPAPLTTFQVKHETMEERRAALYSTARLQQRFMWFEHVFLPSIRAQTDPDFTMLLLLGDDFPEPWRSKLHDLIADVPQIMPLYRPSQNHRKLCRELFHAARAPDADVVVEFRLDDDDAVAVDFVEQLRAHYPVIAPLMQHDGKAGLDFQRGFLVESLDDGLRVRAMSVPQWTPALAAYFRPGHKNCIMDFKHLSIWARMPVVSRSDMLMFVRGSHDTNDSRVIPTRAVPVKIDPEDIVSKFRSRFGIELEALDQAWEKLRDQPDARLPEPKRKKL